MVSVYQEHTALAASSLSVVVPSSSLLQHLPERHQAEQDPDPSTAPSQDQSPINCLLLQAQLSSPALPAPYLSVFTLTMLVTLNPDPQAHIYSFYVASALAHSSPIPSYSSAVKTTSTVQDTPTLFLISSLFPSKCQFTSPCSHSEEQ